MATREEVGDHRAGVGQLEDAEVDGTSPEERVEHRRDERGNGEHEDDTVE